MAKQWIRQKMGRSTGTVQLGRSTGTVSDKTGRSYFVHGNLVGGAGIHSM